MADSKPKAEVLKASSTCFKRSTAHQQFADGLDRYMTIPGTNGCTPEVINFRPCGKTSHKTSVITLDKPTFPTVKYKDGGPRCHHCKIPMVINTVKRDRKYFSPTLGSDGQFTNPYTYECTRCTYTEYIEHNRTWRDDKIIWIPKEVLKPSCNIPATTLLKGLC